MSTPPCTSYSNSDRPQQHYCFVDNFHTFFACSPAELLHLQHPQRRVYQRSPCKANVIAHIRAVSTNQQRNGSVVPDLGHAENRAHPSDDEGHKRCNAQGQLLLSVPYIPVPARR